MHLMAAEGASGSGSQSLLVQEMCEDTVAQKALIGTATASRGPKVEASPHPIFVGTTWQALLCTLSDKIGQAKSCPSFWLIGNK